MTEPIAIVGMACRFPGAPSPEAYWRLLRDGVTAVTEPPSDRPELEPPPWLVEQAPACRRGGFLDAIDQFEPGFFRISPREAARMDPQQRLLLEIAWEALEDAGQPVAKLAGTSTGVFVGVMNADFARRAARDLSQIDAQLGPGSSLGIAPNRISFALDLRGPSMAIDTLCSSSLVATHLACQSLLADESAPIAIAGGVNVILDRTMDVFYARAGLLAKDGLCRAFDASASGIVRGEGIGLVVLKRLARAVADGDRIHAVIRGSAVNQDGRSNGLTSPSRWSQEEVLRTAYRRADVAPRSVAYVETHGTGTLIGDPIETAALGAVMNDGRAAGTSLAIGSVKSNLGHLESAAGVASLIKAVLSLAHRTIVPSLHFASPNPYGHFAERRLRVPTAAEPWPDGPRVTGVSSFGMGGTNAHLVIEAFDDARPARTAGGRSVVVPISARSEQALDAIEARTRAQLAHGDAIEIAHSASVRRDHHDYRRAIVPGGVTLAGSVVAGRTHKLVFVVSEGEVAQQIGAAALWRSLGFEPDEVVYGTPAEASLGDDSTLIFELGPRSLVDRALLEGRAGAIVPPVTSEASLLHAIGLLYCLGVAIDWSRLDVPGARFVPLGSYPWQKQYCGSESMLPDATVLVPSWELASAAETRGVEEWLVLGEGASEVAAALKKSGQRVAASARNVVQLCGADLAPTVRLVQQLAQRTDEVRLWLVTPGASTLDALDGAAAWGFGRVVMNEYPRLHCTLVEIMDLAGDPDALVRELLGDDGEREVALRGADRYVARVTRQLRSAPPLRLRGDAAYLVTGGLGGLGLAAARRLVERGARTVILVGRRGIATDEASRVVAELASRGANVIVERADVTDRAAMAALFDRHDVRGVIHAAGVMTPAMISAIDPAELQTMLAAKLAGARYLHELTASRSLEFFVMYSSVATLLGMPGQGAYAAANAYLDALAAYRRSIGLPATSIAWTVIAGTGMAANADAKALAQLTDRGVSTLSVARSTDLLEHLLAAEAPAQVGAVTFDLAKWASFYPHARTNPRFAPLAEHEANPAPVPSLRARTPEAIEAYLCAALASVLHTDAVEPQRPLRDLGVDSLTAMELQAMILTALDIDLASERLLGDITLRELAFELAAGHTPVASTIVLANEAQLDPSLSFGSRVANPPRGVFLTGATGFLGAFVLAQLLEHTTSKIHCLVRAPTERDGLRRLASTLDRYALPALDLGARVTCVPGDLTKPRLGIEAFDGLASAIDTIVHSGASVNFVYPYEALKPDNVGGTDAILRLAAAANARLHYVSTIGVFPNGPETVYETDRSAHPERLPLGYMRAKWVAEELVGQARGRGLDVSVYRPGTIAGHAKTGAFNPDDFVCALLKGCIQLGLAPHVDAAINLVPVDYVSAALVRIALGSPSGTYHLVGRQTVAWLELVQWIRALGYKLEEVPYLEWRSILRERAVATGNALAPLLPLFVEHDTTDWLQLPVYDDARAEDALRGTGIACPPIDPALVRSYVERFVTSGYLPRP